MKLTLILAFYLIILMISMPAYSARVAFLEAEDVIPVEDESEYKWAKENYGAILIHPAGPGKFKNEKGEKVELSNFQVVWWHRANDKELPKVFLDAEMKKAFMDFVENGGSLFLSQVAFYYVAELGLESTPIRKCDPNVDHAISGIIAVPGQEGHPVFDGFKKMGDDPAKGFNINCYGHDKMCDFYPKGPAKEGTVIAEAYQEPHPRPWFGTVSPLCEYKVGKGTILISGWRFTVFRSGDEKCKYHDKMVKLHENIMSYLGALSSVDPKDKSPVTWGMLKKSYMRLM
ncbi:MAG: DUF4960 domain-containing protein [bacterium]